MPKLPKNVNEEQLKQLKDRYGEKHLRIAELPLDDNNEEFLEVIIRVPDRKTLGEFEKWMEIKPLKAKEILVTSCLLSEKEKVKGDDTLFLTCFDAIAELIPIRKARIKNL